MTKRVFLNITNGDSAADVMRAAGIPGELLPWRDVLHEGPVPAGLTLDQMSEERARFIADSGWATFDEALSGFQQRDAKLSSLRDYDEVILWFEHDLYDQLQLLQLLDFFSRHDKGDTGLSLICIDEYLGTLTPQRMAALQGAQKPVTRHQLDLAARAWKAFCAAQPAEWEALLHEDTCALPFLAGAVLRHLEQYPSVMTGLNRTETELLKALQGQPMPRWRLFEAVQRTEERIFMGDSTFWICMNAMIESQPPLLQRTGERVARTETAGRVLRGELDWIDVNGIDKWLGGVRLTTKLHWRWDTVQHRLVENRQ